MNLNLGSVSGSTLNLGYTGAYRGTVYPSVTMVDPITDDEASVAYQTTHPVVAGDIFEWDDVNSLGNLSVDSSGLVTADTEGSFEGRWFDDGDQVYGDWETYSFQEVATQVPQGTWTIGTITKDKSSASLSPTYSLSDADSYEYSFEGGAWIEFATTISLNSLDPDTAYSGQVRAVNSVGNGSAEGFSFTTDALQPPVNAPIYGSETITHNSISLPFTHSGGDATGFEYRVDGGSWQSVTSPISLSSLTEETGYLIEASAVNADGRGPIVSTTLTTLAAPAVPAGVITASFPQTTQTTVDLQFFYSANDETGFEYSLDGGTWTSTNKPLALTGLTGETTYGLRLRAVNAVGSGTIYSVSFRTKGEPAAPSADNWPFSKGIKPAISVTWEHGKRHPKTGMRTRMHK